MINAMGPQMAILETKDAKPVASLGTDNVHKALICLIRLHQAAEPVIQKKPCCQVFVPNSRAQASKLDICVVLADGFIVSRPAKKSFACTGLSSDTDTSAMRAPCSRTGPMAASWHSARRSDPLYRSVCATNHAVSRSACSVVIQACHLLALLLVREETATQLRTTCYYLLEDPHRWAQHKV
jgi:hypothetical protein